MQGQNVAQNRRNVSALLLVGVIFILCLNKTCNSWHLKLWQKNLKRQILQMFYLVFNPGHIWQSLEIMDAKISLKKVPLKVIPCWGSRYKSNSLSSNRSDIDFYGTKYTSYSQKSFTRQLTNVLIPTNTIFKYCMFSVHSVVLNRFFFKYHTMTNWEYTVDE